MASDPVRLELVKNAIGSVVDEMVLTVIRIAYSSIMKDTMDLSSAFCDRQGRMIAQGLSLPLHLGSIPDAMNGVLAKYGDNMNPGDIVVLNDPYLGGMHLPDIFMFKPIFVGDHLLAMESSSRTTTTSADACPAPAPPTRPRSFRKACAFRS